MKIMVKIMKIMVKIMKIMVKILKLIVEIMKIIFWERDKGTNAGTRAANGGVVTMIFAPLRRLRPLWWFRQRVTGAAPQGCVPARAPARARACVCAALA